MAQVVMTVQCNQEHARTLERHIKQEMALGALRVQSGDEALKHMLSNAPPQPDVILFDMGLDASSLKVISAIRDIRDDVQIIALASHAAVNMAERALSCGASDFLLMPFHPAQLTSTIRNALIRRNLQLELLHARTGERLSLDELKAESTALRATLFLARKFAEADSPVILEGAPGTGRELLARAIHGSSPRCDAPFMVIDPSACTEAEVVVRMFGDEERRGALAVVANGSILLRHADMLTEEARHRLLDVVRDGMPIHHARPEEVFTGRLMFALNDAAYRSLSQDKRGGNLFAKLNALPLSLPQLRDIQEDIPFLAELFCRRYALLEGKPVLGVSATAAMMLREISWPGNMAQLAQTIFHAVMCCQGHELVPEDFRQLFRPQGASVSRLGTAAGSTAGDIAEGGVLHLVDNKGNVKRLEEMEQEMIRYALERYSGHMSEVARHLGIGRSTLYRKISSMEEK